MKKINGIKALCAREISTLTHIFDIQTVEIQPDKKRRKKAKKAKHKQTKNTKETER